MPGKPVNRPLLKFRYKGPFVVVKTIIMKGGDNLLPGTILERGDVGLSRAKVLYRRRMIGLPGDGEHGGDKWSEQAIDRWVSRHHEEAEHLVEREPEVHVEAIDDHFDLMVDDEVLSSFETREEADEAAETLEE